MNEHRLKLLHEVDERGDGNDPLTLMNVMVSSVAYFLADPENHYIGFYARYQVEHGGSAWEADITPWREFMGSYEVLHERLRGLTGHLSDEVFEHRFRLINEWIIYALAQYRRSQPRRRDLRSLEAYCADLAQTLWGGLSAPA